MSVTRGRLLAWWISVALLAAATIALVRWGSGTDPLWPLPATSTSAAAATTKPAEPGAFEVEGVLAGGDKRLVAVDVHRVLAMSPEAKSHFGGRCPTVTVESPPHGTAIDEDGTAVPMVRILRSGVYLRVVGRVQAGHLVYDRLEVIPFPDDIATVAGVCPD